jgi:diguanylate cyclase (GGDEF)-like protein
MKEPSIPLDETVRLQSLHSLRILDSVPEERFDRITRMAQRLFEVDICLVSFVASDRQWFRSRQGHNGQGAPRNISFRGHTACGDILLVVEDTLVDPRFADDSLVIDDLPIRFFAGHPIYAPNGQHIGVICIADSEPRRLSTSDEQTLKDFAALVDDELASSSRIHVDELTGIANRRGFMTVATHILPLCARNGLSVELLFFDLDDFKHFNDEFGHDVGDRALQLFAKSLLKGFRSADVVARLGGDEFAVMMVGERAFSQRALKALRTRIEKMQRDLPMRLRWSVGSVRYDESSHGSVEEFLAEADKRMYADKFRNSHIVS